MGEQSDQRKESQQGWRSAQNRQVRPLALGFDAETGARFLKGDFQLPAQNRPFHNLRRLNSAISAEERLGLQRLSRVRIQLVCNQHPAQRNWRQPVMIPDCSVRSQTKPTCSAAIPDDSMLSPDGRRVVYTCGQVWLPCTLLAWRTAFARLPRRGRIIQRCIQPQPSHHRYGPRQVLTGGQQFQGRIRTVSSNDQPPLGQPCIQLNDHLARPIGEQFVLVLAPLVISLRKRQHRQEGQGPHPLRSGNRNQQHNTKPTKPTRLDEERLARPHGVSIDSPCGNFGATSSFNMIINPEDQ